MDEKKLLEQTRKLKALIRKQQLKNAIETVGAISTVIIVVGTIILFIILVFNL